MENQTDISHLTVNESEELRCLKHLVEIVSSCSELESMVRQVADYIALITKADAVNIYMKNSNQNGFCLVKSTALAELNEEINVEPEQGFTGQAANLRKIVNVGSKAYADERFCKSDSPAHDVIESVLAVPVVFKGSVEGVFTILHIRPSEYSVQMLNLISIATKIFAGAFENARFFGEKRSKDIRLDYLIKVSQSITSEKYLDEILNLIVVVTSEMFDSKICSIMLLDEKNNHLAIKVTNSLSPEYKNKPALKLDSLSGEVLRDRMPRAVLDVKKEEKYVFHDLAIKENLSSMLLVPMIVKNKAIGIINVYTKTVRHFSPQEIDTLQIISNQAAVAIENTKLMEETVKIKETLETRKTIDRAKGILMEASGLNEDAAYKLIKKKSMDSCKSMKEIAEAIILMSDLKKSV